LENLEIDTSLDTYDLSKLNQEDIKNLDRSIISSKIERVMKSSNKEKPKTRWNPSDHGSFL
jgi:hypothetical protein